jgi:hypothetical protein
LTAQRNRQFLNNIGYLYRRNELNGIIFFEDGTVQMIGQLVTVRMIAMKVQEVIPKLVQQERDAIIDTMNEAELRRAVDTLSKKRQ